MRILWFTNTPSLYDQGKHLYHGGGWIESLEQLIKDKEEIELAVSFFHPTDNEKVVQSKTTYYPILRKLEKKNPVKKLIANWKGKIEIKDLEIDIKRIIQDYQPDVIQVFGTEGPFSQVQNHTQIPVIYHIQGLIGPCLNTYLPINQSKFSFHLNFDYLSKTIKGNNPAFDYKRFQKQAIREKEVLKKARLVMGRTHWDKMFVELYNPQVEYFHVDEVLRAVFYKADFASHQKSNKQYKIISTLSPTVYKGIDVVLKTAKKLKEICGFKFQWEIIGLEKSATLLQHFEKTEKIMHQDVGIICSGRKSPEEIIEIMQEADVFVHPSYIDNSPNSVCEAQTLGLPVIACNVGGVSTLVEHKETGFLVPSNGVFELVHYLRKLHGDKNLGDKIGQQARLIASQRHNRDKILTDILAVYSKLIN